MRKVYEVYSGSYDNEYLVGFYRTLEEAKATMTGSWLKIDIPAGCVGHDKNFWENEQSEGEISEIDEPEWLTRLQSPQPVCDTDRAS